MRKWEVELPQNLLGWMRSMAKIALLLVLLAGLVRLGKAVSPVDTRGRPYLLSPRLARVAAYQRNVKTWAASLQEIQTELGAILSTPAVDILTVDQHLNLLHGRLISLQAELDGTSVPPTLKPLQVSMGEAVNASLNAAMLVSAWVSEPTPETLQTASESLRLAGNLLDEIHQSPWVQETP